VLYQTGLPQEADIVGAEKDKRHTQEGGKIFVMAWIHIPPYAPYFLILIPILVIDLCDHALMYYDIVEGFCLYLYSCA
jgi:hypothetical protein